ncbi:MAG TPA: hypothetical protein VMY76_11150 [Gemmatimonadales bacterium]|nr:hypothetical protein [Gemmatimonadales bacterium]
MRPNLRSLASALALTVACAAPSAAPTPSRGPGDSGRAVSAAESSYAVTRDLRDHIDVTAAAGSWVAADGTPLDVLAARYDAARTDLAHRLSAVDSTALAGDDLRALGLMRRTLERDLGPLAAASGQSGDTAPPDCHFDPGAIAGGPRALDSLRARTYACYGWAQSHLVAGADTMDRLSILGALGRTDSANRRRELFLALEPVWRSVNGTNRSDSPYRALIALEARPRGADDSPATLQARASGLDPDSLEHWLMAILETWRDATPDSLVEPWDWYYQTGSTSRKLGPQVSRQRLIELNAAVWAALGVDVGALRVHYDLEPRNGKDPVAFTTFGARAPLIEPWVFATYRTGGLDNLNELLHETGHAAHIGAIRTRPAFRDWPDSDPFTEAVADVAALDVYEPAWQQRWLGDSVPLAEGIRSRYGGIVMDVAWALFESRMLRDPGADPNAVWTGLTRDYLHIRPHPELSWWAMRGQLVDAPGYMMNYAAGAILIAAVRARIRELHGPFVTGDSTWYGWVAPRLLRFGLERPTREVLGEFLGGPVSPEALLADLRRMVR